MCFCLKWCCGCDCLFCEPQEDWSITQDTRPGEYGAGWMYKRGKNHAVWGKRFFVAKDTKLLYYTDESRSNLKGEISLVGVSVKTSPTRPNANRQYHLIIQHPQSGVRELYAKNNVRRSQWIDLLNNISNSITSSMSGNLLKQGGLGKSTWQERYCVCAGRELDYFETVLDNQPKGSINMNGAKIREFTLKDQKYCFEVVSAPGGKKGSKKYIFSCPSEDVRRKWMDQLSKATTYTPRMINMAGVQGGQPGGGGANEPINRNNRNSSDASEEGSSPSGSGGGFFGRSAKKTNYPPEKRGYLMKKSPSMFTGYQKRYFVLCAPGDLRYYETEEDARNDRGMKGVVQVAEVMPDAKGLESLAPKLPNEFVVRVSGSKSYHLQCSSQDEAKQWMDAITGWMMHLSSDD